MDIKRELMQFFSNQFMTKTRDDGTEFTCLGDNVPAWCTEVVHSAHGDYLPDDWRYHWIAAASDFFADNDPDNWDELLNEETDSLVNVYNSDLLRWLSSNLTRSGYVNDAVNEMGFPDEFDIFHTIMMGQYEEIRETLESLLSSISDIAENAEPYAAGYNL